MQKLVGKQACLEQRAKFKELWGKQLEVTEEALAPHAEHFDWWWAAENLLTKEGQRAYAVERDMQSVKAEAAKQAARAIRDAELDKVEGYEQEAIDKRGLIYDFFSAKVSEINQATDEWEARAFARHYIADGQPKQETPKEEQPPAATGTDNG
jgi:hypothetical protein